MELILLIIVAIIFQVISYHRGINRGRMEIIEQARAQGIDVEVRGV